MRLTFLGGVQTVTGSCYLIQEEQELLKLVFSGDLGRYHSLILKNPTPIDNAHVLLVESTYGNRLHKSLEASEEELVEIIKQAHREKGKVLIPSFAVGRTQEVLYILNKAYNEGRIPHISVYLDSPLAIAATEIFQHHPECFDKETLDLMKTDPYPFSFPGLKMVRSAEESRVLNSIEEGVIIAGSGMCTGGRIKHHLKHNLWKSNTHIIFAGFQTKGTLGRRLVDGASKVKIYGEEIEVRAQIHTLGGFSAHADQEELLYWLNQFEKPPLITFVVHGEEENSLIFSQKIQNTLGWKTHLPALGESVDLSPQAIGPFHPPKLEVPIPKDLGEEFQELEGILGHLQDKVEKWRQHPYQPTLRERMARLIRLLKRVEKDLEEK